MSSAEKAGEQGQLLPHQTMSYQINLYQEASDYTSEQCLHFSQHFSSHQPVSCSSWPVVLVFQIS